jgi:hypothetical protein
LLLLKRCAACLASLWVKFPPRLQLSEHLQWCSVSHPTYHAQIFLTPKFFFCPATPPIKLKLGLQRGKTQETTNSNPPRPIKLSSQSTGVKLCCACYQPLHHHVQQQCRTKTISLEPKWHVLTFLHPINHRLEGSFLIVFVNWLNERFCISRGLTLHLVYIASHL